MWLYEYLFIFVDDEQKSWVRLAEKNSNNCSIKYATSQGSIISPYFFSSWYLYNLIVTLMKLDLGCHAIGMCMWVEASANADDLALLAPDMSTLQKTGWRL